MEGGSFLIALCKVLLPALIFYLYDAVLQRRVLQWLRKRSTVTANGTNGVEKPTPKPTAPAPDASYRTTLYAAMARIVGSTHNLIQLPLAVAVLWKYSVDPSRQSRLTFQSAESEFMIIISSGYFVYDLIVCLERYDVEGPLYLGHALACLTVYFFGVYSGLMHFYGAGFLLWELSTPFVHLRWCLFKFFQKQETLQQLNGAAMVIAFFLCRIVWGTYLSAIYLQDSLADLSKHPHNVLPKTFIYISWIACIGLNCLNYYWFSLMVSRVIQIFQGRCSKGALGLHPAELGANKKAY